MAKLTKAQIKTELKSLEQTLVEHIPEWVKDNPCDGPAYALMLCYQDLSVDAGFAPVIVVAPQSIRDEHAEEAKRDGGRAGWVPHVEFYESEGLSEIEIIDEEICQQFADVYESMIDKWDNEEEDVILDPIRKAMLRIVKSLNTLDWSEYLEVTDDFVVVTVDYAGNSWMKTLVYSMTAAMRKKQSQAGWLGSPIRRGRNPVHALTNELKAMKVDARIERLVAMLDRMHEGKKTGAFDGDPSRAVDLLSECGKKAQLPMVEFVEARMGQSHIDYEKRKPGFRLTGHMLGMMPKRDDMDARAKPLLQSIIRKCLPESDLPFPRGMINSAAGLLHRGFDYPEPKDTSVYDLASNVDDFLR